MNKRIGRKKELPTSSLSLVASFFSFLTRWIFIFLIPYFFFLSYFLWIGDLSPFLNDFIDNAKLCISRNSLSTMERNFIIQVVTFILLQKKIIFSLQCAISVSRSWNDFRAMENLVVSSLLSEAIVCYCSVLFLSWSPLLASMDITATLALRHRGFI